MAEINVNTTYLNLNTDVHKEHGAHFNFPGGQD